MLTAFFGKTPEGVLAESVALNFREKPVWKLHTGGVEKWVETEEYLFVRGVMGEFFLVRGKWRKNLGKSDPFHGKFGGRRPAPIANAVGRRRGDWMRSAEKPLKA